MTRIKELMKSKIKNIRTISKVIGNLKRKKKKIVFTNGCFDLLHIGHTRYLKNAGNLGDILIVGVNSDNSVKKLKGKNRPVVPQNERAEILSELPFVDLVVIFNEETPYKLIKRVLPDVLVKGGDWKVNDIIGGDIVKANGGKVISIPLIKGRSTSNMLKKAKLL